MRRLAAGVVLVFAFLVSGGIAASADNTVQLGASMWSSWLSQCAELAERRCQDPLPLCPDELVAGTNVNHCHLRGACVVEVARGCAVEIILRLVAPIPPLQPEDNPT